LVDFRTLECLSRYLCKESAINMKNIVCFCFDMK